MLSSYLCIVIVFLLPKLGSAQLFDPYSRMVDPLAIADLGQPDSGLSFHSSFVHGGYGEESEGYRILVDVRTKGVVSHLWLTHPDPTFDTSAYIRIFIDDELLYDGKLVGFFLSPQGIWASSLIRHESGGLVSDLQYTFERNFKITFKGSYTFFAISWRELQDGIEVPKFTQLTETRSEAEANFKASLIPGLPSSNERRSNTFTVAPEESQVIFEDQGTGILQRVHFLPTNFDPAVYRNVWLVCQWDGNPHPAIEVPLADFFASAYGLHTVNAIQLKADAQSGFVSLLPMPYKAGARITVVNRSRTTVSTKVDLSINRTYDRHFGRLHAQFNEVLSPRVRHLLPILHLKGRGRVLGVIFNMREDANPFFLEGDPILVADSQKQLQLRYPGTEDYFNGGWYFREGPFSGPFAGCPNRWTSLYRFHYLDPINFRSSIDWKWQHGANSDFGEAYRTVGLAYVDPFPYWLSQDSVLSGKEVEIAGIGYTPDSDIELDLGFVSAIVRVGADGSFSTKVATDGSSSGQYKILVNEVEYPRLLTILQIPTLECVIDSQYPALYLEDSLEIFLRGFSPESWVELSLDGKNFGELVGIDTRGCGYLMCKLPRIDSGLHVLSALDQSGRTANTHFQSRRVLRYEIEDLPITSSDAPYDPTYMGWWNYGRWSNMEILFVAPPEQGRGVTTTFNVPFEADYEIEISSTKGLRYGTMGVSIDGQVMGEIDCFFDTIYNAPLPRSALTLGTKHLSRGSHTLSFTAVGKHASAPEFALGPDALFLTPQGEIQTVESAQKQTSASFRIVYRFGSPIFSLDLMNADVAQVEITLFDALGRQLRRIYHGEVVQQIAGVVSSNDLATGMYFIRWRVDDDNQGASPVLLFSKE